MKGLRVFSLIAILLLGSVSFALAGSSTSYQVKAYVPQTNGLSVSISKVLVPGDTWQTGQSSVDFGTLTFDTTYKIFRATCYYAVDVGVNSNNADWTISHTHYSVANGSNSLDNNINVDFVKQTSDTSGTSLQKTSFANSDKSFSKSQLSGGWLRIYYGIATGKDDAPGVVPITTDKPYGQYSGSVTLTLTP